MAQPPDSPTPVRDIAAGARPPLALDPALPRGMFFLLAIAIDGYTGFNPLRNAVNGARSLAAVLQRKFGFASERVRMLLETAATRDNILKVLREVILALGEHDSLVVYYAGHGHLDKELQIGYWIPVQAEPGNLGSWITHKEIKEMLGAAKARHILLLVDSCFSGDLLRETEGPVVEISEPHVRYAFGRKSRHVLTSGANEPVPDDGFPGHSTFMGFLLLELEESRHPWVLIQDLHCRVRGAVAVNSGQKPQFGHLFGAGGERDGEFVLLNQACEQVSANATVTSPTIQIPASPKPPLALAGFPMPPLRIELTPRTKTVAAGPHLPPVPEEILELQGWCTALEEALAQLKDDRHSQLEPLLAARAGATSLETAFQTELSARAPAALAALPAPERQKLEAAFRQGLDGSLARLGKLCPQISEPELLAYLRLLRLVVRAEVIGAQARRDYYASKQVEAKRLQALLEERRAGLQSRQEADFAGILDLLASVAPPGSPFPEATWSSWEEELERRSLPWTLGECYDRAVGHFDEQAWNLAVSSDNLAGWQTYLQAFPQGRYVSAAEASIAALLEVDAWQIAWARKDAAGCTAYLTAYPNGKHADQAKEWLATARDEVAWAVAVGLGTLRAQQDYRSQFPNGRYVETVSQREQAEAAEAKKRAEAEQEVAELAAARKSAEQGNASGQNRLGDMYYDGRGGLAQDYAEAVKWYHLAANQGNAYGQDVLAYMYERGRGVAQDYAKAVKWYRLAADQGDSFGQNRLASMYERGLGVSQDYAEAVKWYRLAANQGNAYGQVNLAGMHELGLGVAHDYAEAVKWYRLAADQGNAYGQYNLARMYESGLGVAQDDTAAVVWYRKAAEQGNADGQARLGDMHCYGRGGLAQDDAEAVKWYRLAADQGHSQAQSQLEKLIGKKTT